MAHKNNSRVNPQGAMLVWAYKVRSTSTAFTTANAQKINWGYKLTKSLISMRTTKTKASPAGTFEVRLAPTANWIARLTPGSWCCLLMTSDVELEIESLSSAKADRRSLKFLGRIKEVRVSVKVDQTTGTRQTEYVVTGEDWGGIFNSKLYIDPVARGKVETPDGEKTNAVSTAWKLIFDLQLLEWSGDNAIPSSTDNVKALVKCWGAPVQELKNNIDELKTMGLEQINLNSGTFTFPKQLTKFLGLDVVTESTAIADNITFITGRLFKSDGRFNAKGEAAGAYDSVAGDIPEPPPYKEIAEASGMPDPHSLFDVHALWQLLYANCNETINELFTDLRWDGSVPTLALYKRIRPFIVNGEFEGKDAKGIEDKIAYFSDIRAYKLALGEITDINAGTNWGQLINFAEVRPSPSLFSGVISSDLKREAQTKDGRPSFARHGFKPIIKTSHYLPYDINPDKPGLDVEAFNAWKYLIKEWHFNTHAMLNGTISFLGQNTHIGIGDNLMIPAEVLGPAQNFNKHQLEELAQDGSVFLTVHIESLTNTFNVNPNGARTFTTQVTFTRGIFTYADGEYIGFIDDDGIAIDKVQGATFKETSGVDVWATSTEGDPV